MYNVDTCFQTMFGGGGGGGRKKDEKPRRDRGGRGQMPLLMGVPGMEDNLDAMLEDDTELEAELAALVGGGGGGGGRGGKGRSKETGKRGGEVDLDAMVASCMKDYGSGETSITMNKWLNNYFTTQATSSATRKILTFSQNFKGWRETVSQAWQAAREAGCSRSSKRTRMELVTASSRRSKTGSRCTARRSRWLVHRGREAKPGELREALKPFW